MKINISIPLFLAAILFSGCNGKGINPFSNEASIPVLTRKISMTRSEEIIKLSGNIEGFKTVRIGFLVAGRINYISANEGDLISKDQLVASLDPVSYEIAKEIADIQVKQVQDEYDRLKIMHDNNSLSESDFAKITYGLQQAEAQKKLHTKNLADTRLYSPFSGVLLKKLCETGEITGAGIPLFVISDIRVLKVSAFIPEEELHKIKTGQEAIIRVPSLSDTLKGKIIEVGSVADIASRSFPIKIEVNNPGLLARPGMIAEISINSGSGNEIIEIPVQAVQHDYNNLSFVYVLDTLKNRAFRRNVAIGRLKGNNIEITAGLDENEVLITGGIQKLIDGSPVTISK